MDAEKRLTDDNHFNYCCILTLERTGCSSCVNEVIKGCTRVNRKAVIIRCKQLTWVELEICRREIIYTQVPTKSQ